MELGKAPPPPAWPDELPDGYETENGTVLPFPTNWFVMGRLLYLDHIYPEVAQIAIDKYAEHLQEQADKRVDKAKAEGAQELILMEADLGSRWPHWLVGLVIGGTAILCIGIGFLAGSASAGAFH